MRSRIIPSVPETIILYRTGTYTDSIKQTADKLGIRTVCASDDAAGEKVGFLAGYSGYSSNGSSEQAEQGCIIFAEIGGKRLDAVLAELRTAGVSVPYKAVVTPSNKDWTLNSLISELMREREKLGG